MKIWFIHEIEDKNIPLEEKPEFGEAGSRRDMFYAEPPRYQGNDVDENNKFLERELIKELL